MVEIEHHNTGHRVPLSQKVDIVEDFVYSGLTIQQLSIVHNVAPQTVSACISKYFAKPLFSLVLPSKV
jgi:hypothetical protein